MPEPKSFRFAAYQGIVQSDRVFIFSISGMCQGTNSFIKIEKYQKHIIYIYLYLTQ